jgi:hypothetical protein
LSCGTARGTRHAQSLLDDRFEVWGIEEREAFGCDGLGKSFLKMVAKLVLDVGLIRHEFEPL